MNPLGLFFLTAAPPNDLFTVYGVNYIGGVHSSTTSRVVASVLDTDINGNPTVIPPAMWTDWKFPQLGAPSANPIDVADGSLTVWNYQQAMILNSLPNYRNVWTATISNGWTLSGSPKAQTDFAGLLSLLNSPTAAMHGMGPNDVVTIPDASGKPQSATGALMSSYLTEYGNHMTVKVMFYEQQYLLPILTATTLAQLDMIVLSSSLISTDSSMKLSRGVR